MEENYYFSDDFTQEEKEQLARKAAYYINCDILPDEIVKPKQLLYEENLCVGYCYHQPEYPYITLKDLFSGEKMEQYHVDGHLLLSIAKKVLYIMSELNEKGIYAGFLELDSILVHKDRPDKAVMIAHPEYFQTGDLPSSYPWYPSDVRLFEEEFDFFDEKSQKKADAKLVYKILTACEKGNAKIPPNSKQQELSFLFWNILSREWKDYFLDLPEKEVDYKELMDLLSQSIEEEKFYMSPEEKRITEENGIPAASSSGNRRKAYAAIVILREALKSAHDVSRELYLLQEKLEMDPFYEFEQAFIMGDRHPFARDFQAYPLEFRAQLAHSIRSYSFGEVLLVSAEMMEQAQIREERTSAMYIILDGELKQDAMFMASLKKLQEMQRKWHTKVQVLPVREFHGEGYQRLAELAD